MGLDYFMGWVEQSLTQSPLEAILEGPPKKIPQISERPSRIIDNPAGAQRHTTSEVCSSQGKLTALPGVTDGVKVPRDALRGRLSVDGSLRRAKASQLWADPGGARGCALLTCCVFLPLLFFFFLFFSS